MLRKHQIKVPQSFVLSRKWKITDILKSIKENNIHFPVVVKPATGEHGN
jgi:glutathione synthase/RimK-type ligase-like ATP-grasp enzyme